jgi:hypothetical protein
MLQPHISQIDTQVQNRPRPNAIPLIPLLGRYRPSSEISESTAKQYVRNLALETQLKRKPIGTLLHLNSEIFQSVRPDPI